jgi:chemotaxis protein methyltransferase CheR
MGEPLMLAATRYAPIRVASMHPGAMSQDPISDEEFESFRSFFVEKTGMQFDPSKRYFVDRRLLDRIDATRARNFRDYFGRLRADDQGEEMQHLTNAMTVNETYFFREEHHFRCLVRSILPELTTLRAPDEPFRIWVVPSSTGEEAYSIVLYLLEHWPALAHRDVEILASDIDTRVLYDARRGRFGQRSVQFLPPGVLKRYFRQVGGEYEIDDEIRRSVQFSRVNITNPAEVHAMRNLDVIFCRNLLFYFDEAARRRAAGAFFDVLRPGGFVCLGISDSMSRISSQYLRRAFPDAVVYQKPLGADA